MKKKLLPSSEFTNITKERENPSDQDGPGSPECENPTMKERDEREWKEASGEVPEIVRGLVPFRRGDCDAIKVERSESLEADVKGDAVLQ